MYGGESDSAITSELIRLTAIPKLSGGARASEQVPFVSPGASPAPHPETAGTDSPASRVTVHAGQAETARQFQPFKSSYWKAKTFIWSKIMK